MSKAIKQSFDVFGLPVYKCDDGTEWAVGSERQADKAARAAVEDSLWAFKTTFLVAFLERVNPYLRKMTNSASNAFEKALGKVQEDACEDAGPVIRALIGPHLKTFANEAISADGRGHFLSSYDGEERDSDEIDGLPKGKLAYRAN